METRVLSVVAFVWLGNRRTPGICIQTPSELNPFDWRPHFYLCFSVWPVEHCPRVLAAAQTLYGIATCSSRLNQDGRMKWPKKPSQKVMKARKSRSNDKHEIKFAQSASQRNVDQRVTTSKRPKMSTSEDKEDFAHINGVQKGPIIWSTPKSSRSSPNKSDRDSTAYVVKHSCMMPPPAKVINRTCNSQQKVRRLMRMDWSREEWWNAIPTCDSWCWCPTCQTGLMYIVGLL